MKPEELEELQKADCLLTDKWNELVVLIQTSQVRVQIINPVAVAASALVILRESSLELTFGAEAERQKKKG